jgi:YD repeat-containing protein
MKPIVLKNEFGEKMEVMWDDDGNIRVRHSDIDPTKFGELHEYSKQSRPPALGARLRTKGFDPTSSTSHELLGKMGACLVIEGKSYIIGRDEAAMIYDAVKQHGGIIPNRSAEP